MAIEHRENTHKTSDCISVENFERTMRKFVSSYEIFATKLNSKLAS
jgi:hypothetical protein